MADNDENPQGSTLIKCGAGGAEHGPVIGCCYLCGLLLCEQHVMHLPRTWQLGTVDQVAPLPLVCGDHAGMAAKKGLPLRNAPATKRVAAGRANRTQSRGARK